MEAQERNASHYTHGWNEQISTLSQDTIVLISGTKEVEILPNEEMKIDKR